MKVNKLIESLEKEFKKKSNPTVAKSQKAYMRNQFDFHGLTANERIKYLFMKKPKNVDASLEQVNYVENQSTSDRV